MLKQRHSRTAEATAAIRASHLLYDEPVIFADPYAIDLTSPLWRTVCRHPLLHRAVVRGALGRLRPVHGWIIVRDRVTEHRLQAFVANGGAQYVLLGAGFDSTALRRPAWLADTRIIEVDHPATQAVKLQRMRRLDGFSIAENFEAVSVDFEHESLRERLVASTLDRTRPAFFAWLGVIYYLTDAAIREALAAIASVSPAGGELLLDFLLPERTDRPNAGGRSVMSLARRVTTRMGETYISFHQPDDIAGILDDSGFEIVEMLSDADLAQRYCSGRSDDLTVMAGFGMVHARRRAIKGVRLD